MTNTQEKLDLIAEIQSHLDLLKVEFEQKRDEILTPEIKQALADLEVEYESTATPAQEKINALTDEVKADVILAGASVKGKFLQAVWAKGRVSWDTKALDGYAAAHPEIQPFRKEGEPSVSIRVVK